MTARSVLSSTDVPHGRRGGQASPDRRAAGAQKHEDGCGTNGSQGAPLELTLPKNNHRSAHRHARRRRLRRQLQLGRRDRAPPGRRSPGDRRRQPARAASPASSVYVVSVFDQIPRPGPRRRALIRPRGAAVLGSVAVSGRIQALVLLSVVGASSCPPHPHVARWRQWSGQREATDIGPTGVRVRGSRARRREHLCLGGEDLRPGLPERHAADRGAYHECLRNGGGEVSCRDDGPRVRRDVANLGRRYATSRTTPVPVGTEARLRRAWANPLRTAIVLTRDIFVRSCLSGGPIRESQRP